MFRTGSDFTAIPLLPVHLQDVAWCLELVCSEYSKRCLPSFLSCPYNTAPTNKKQMRWVNSTISAQCYNGTGPVNMGIYANGVQAVYLSNWFNQWLYTIMWGFQVRSTVLSHSCYCTTMMQCHCTHQIPHTAAEACSTSKGV